MDGGRAEWRRGDVLGSGEPSQLEELVASACITEQ